MLVLSRKEGEKLRLGEEIRITVMKVGNDKVRLGIEAPSNVLVLRDELETHDSNEIEGREQLRVVFADVVVETPPKPIRMAA